ncbi:interferon alpha-1/13-like isoform X1 [Ambystoma mexicanum]|uniref:interferon alpha-1/13-like isoform X1 n=1 Tax=Ambystoma mexicanum TaxID=8296 RepID=UPI0037E807D8
MMTLSLGSVRGACLLLGWCSVAFSLHCKWLQPGQERLSKVILLNFQRLVSGHSGTCVIQGGAGCRLSLAGTQYHCKWLQRGQERLTKVILLNFQRLGDGEVFPTQCVKQSGFPADIDAVYNTTEVETAVLALRDVTQRINRFYSNPRPSLGLDRLRLERFLASLEQRTNDLRDCIDINRINAALHWETSKALEKYFRKLDDIATEKDNSVCARNVIRIEVGRQLQSAARLATNIRKMHILQTSLSP